MVVTPAELESRFLKIDLLAEINLDKVESYFQDGVMLNFRYALNSKAAKK